MTVDAKLQEIIDNNISTDILFDAPSLTLFFEVYCYESKIEVCLRRRSASGMTYYVDSFSEDTANFYLEDLFANINVKARNMVTDIHASKVIDEDVCKAIAKQLNGGAESTMHVIVGGDSADDS